MEVRPYDGASRLDFTLAEGPLLAVQQSANVRFSSARRAATGREPPVREMQGDLIGKCKSLSFALSHLRLSASELLAAMEARSHTGQDIPLSEWS